MSWRSASVAPSGRDAAQRSSPTRSRAFIWSAQRGSAFGVGGTCRRPCRLRSTVGRHVAVADVEVVVGAQLRRAQTELLGGVAMRSVRAGAVGLLPVAQHSNHFRAQLEAE